MPEPVTSTSGPRETTGRELGPDTETSLEQLRTAEERLRAQDEELVATRALLEAERQRYGDLFELARVGYLVTDLHGAILEANRQAAEMLEVSTQLLVGEPLAVYVAPEDRRALRNRLREIARDGQEPEAWHIRLRPGDSPPLPVQAVVRRAAAAAPGELWWILRGTEESRQIETRRWHAQLGDDGAAKLPSERTERAEREFVTNAAHQLQTPLAGIMSAVEVLQAGAKEDPESRERFLAHVERECARLDRLARALLLLARVEIGVEPPRRELVELLSCLEETAALLTPAPGVAVEIDCPPDLALITNRDLVAELLTNLGNNAAKYTVEGSIVLRARAEGETAVTVEVADTGPGVPADERARVFERFFRGGGSESQRDGAGLGLAIVKAGAEALGGQVELRSTPGGGTTVAVTLPGATLVRR